MLQKFDLIDLIFDRYLLKKGVGTEVTTSFSAVVAVGIDINGKTTILGPRGHKERHKNIADKISGSIFLIRWSGSKNGRKVLRSFVHFYFWAAAVVDKKCCDEIFFWDTKR